MKTIPKRRLSRSAFKAWLKTYSRRDTSIVGLSASSCRCPIARYLGGEAIVSLHKYYRKNERWRRLPEWASDFIEKVDRANPTFTPITVKEALEVLEKLI